ncbi:PEP-CTERM sorting domain-containing protein [Mariniblastus fucicola]|uniref:PEP-CTERM protein-sorting domain-containing protein n=1 Tax=Mariniblastus fucicola TaxID=980251 RepID=A0A5B9PHL2_9BACT|nr:PEP-CTERM sorting domain-containing protein [Mariniblastus fucicola]QEG24152.1 hypothetical protein MFFC18_40680 [Mariniblastus fucicola]
MNVRNVFSLAIVALVACCSQGFAQTYSLGYDQTRYDVSPGDSVDVTLILTEEIADGETARLAGGGTDGLFAFGLGVDYSSFTGGASGSTFGSITFNSDFLQSDPDFVQVFDSGSVVSFETSETSGQGVSGMMISPNEYQLELATLSFDAGAINSLTTLQLRTGEAPVTNPALFFADGETPAVGFGSTQIFVNAVPEPGSAAILAIVAGVGVLRRRRK